MPITSLARHAEATHRPRPALADTTLAAQRRTSPPGAAPPAEPTRLQVTLDLDLTVNGPDGADSALRSLDALRAAIAALGTGSVAVAAGGPPTVAGRAPGVGDGAPSPGAPPAAAAVRWLDAEGAGDALLRILPDERAVRRGHDEIRLTRLEFDLLLFFAEHPRRVFTRPQLLAAVWGHAHGQGRTIDVHVRRLRMKFGDGFLSTVRGVGYRLGRDARVAVLRKRPANH